MCLLQEAILEDYVGIASIKCTYNTHLFIYLSPLPDWELFEDMTLSGYLYLSLT
jgi:hypothetical protein